MHVAEDDVVHRVAVGHGDRDGEERDAALRVERAVDRIDDDAPAAVTGDAGLLADDRHVAAAAQAFENHPFGRRVDGGGVVAAEAGADDRLTLRTAGKLAEHGGDVVAGGATEGEPLVHATGKRSSPEVSLG